MVVLGIKGFQRSIPKFELGLQKGVGRHSLSSKRETDTAGAVGRDTDRERL